MNEKGRLSGALSVQADLVLSQLLSNILLQYIPAEKITFVNYAENDFPLKQQ